MILTVTPNPSLDRTYEVPSLDRGEVIRATGERMDPGGKGVNVSRAVAAAGRRTVAVLPLGGAPGALVADLLDAQGIEVAPVPVAGATRSNIALAEADGVLTKINAPGPELTAAEQELLLETVRGSPATPTGSPAAAASRAASRRPGTPSWSPAPTPPASVSPSTPPAPRSSRPCANAPTS
jgi:1-phosphofructokinase